MQSSLSTTFHVLGHRDACLLLPQKAKQLRHACEDDTVRSGHAGIGSITAHVLETAPCFVLLDFRWVAANDALRPTSFSTF